MLTILLSDNTIKSPLSYHYTIVLLYRYTHNFKMCFTDTKMNSRGAKAEMYIIQESKNIEKI